MSGERVATERLWRTADGRVVHDGDVDAVQLIAAEGDVIPDGFDAPKKASKPADKSVPAPDGDKNAGPDEPAKSASKADWEAYRAAQGYVVGGATKEQLVAGDELQRADGV